MHPSVDQEATVNGRTAGLPTGWARPGQLGFRKVKPAKIRGKAAERQRRSASHALVDRIGLAALDVAAARAEVDRPARDTLSKHAAKAWKAAKLSPITVEKISFRPQRLLAGR